MMNPWRVWLLSLTLVASMTAPASGTLVPAFSLRHLAVEADDVVHGDVVDEDVVYDPTTDRIYTHSLVRVRETLHTARPLAAPSVGALVIVRQIGGVLDGREMSVVGTRPLLPGEEVVLFARTNGLFHYLVGMSQGAYGVHRVPGAEPALRRSTHGLGLVERQGPAGVAAPDQLLLRDLKTSLSDLSRGGTP